MIYVLAFSASFIFVALKAFQQLNVMKSKYLWVVPTSMAMAVCEVLLIVKAAEYGWGLIVLPIGLGGGTGCLLSMKIHSIISK